MTLTEADTCRRYVVPKLQNAGWDQSPHAIAEQRYFTDGRIYPLAQGARRGKGKKADYLLRYRRDLTIAVVEAKPEYRRPGDGLGQAKEYAEILGLSFAYSTNGHGIVEFDYTTGLESEMETFPSPEELWRRLVAAQGMDSTTETALLQATHFDPSRSLRYYQELAVNRTVQAVVQGKRRVLLTMATGTGKTHVAFQVCWKLWNAKWNREAAHRRPRILYLADRNILVDDPKDKAFAAFGDARSKISSGEVVMSREMYFAIYQAIAEDESRPGLFREFPPDFFDLVIVDECHRGSASDESNWRSILEYFSAASQVGMTATPLREDNRDTYEYFGSPIYTYSLRQGIEDGFLAPYRVHRVVTTWDAAGWRPDDGQLDRYGREVPDREYGTPDFEKVVALEARTHALARHLTEFLKESDRFGKTIVFCVDQEHALEMRRELVNLNADLVRAHPDYVCRVTSLEGDIGKAHLARFQELDRETPVVLTTSHLLTTGVDAPTCRNIVIARPVRSMPEFKQIIGRGTRVRDDYNKFYFNIIDYTGSATRLFSDPDFDGDPAVTVEESIDEQGLLVPGTRTEIEDASLEREAAESTIDVSLDVADSEVTPRKLYVDGGSVEIAAHLVYELDSHGRQLRVVRFTEYAADKVRSLYRSASDMRHDWMNPIGRRQIADALADRGIDLDDLALSSGQPDADPFDLLCNIAFNAPIRTRRERASRLQKEDGEFWSEYPPEARQILEELLDKYVEFGATQFVLPDVLEIPPVSYHGSLMDIVALFGNESILKGAVDDLQTRIYAD